MVHLVKANTIIWYEISRMNFVFVGVFAASPQPNFRDKISLSIKHLGHLRLEIVHNLRLLVHILHIFYELKTFVIMFT